MQLKKRVFFLIGIILTVGLITIHTFNKVGAAHNSITTKRPISKPKATHMRTPINWHKSSEKIAYQNINKYPGLWIHVSLEKQRMYLINHKHIIYTMYISSGVPTADRRTPRGTYYVQAERGKYFYSAAVNEGAYYWVSWLNHGEYLFHSTPVDSQGHFIKSDASDLGKRPSSHGCIHLSIADSKWVYNNIKYGTKILIN